MTKPLPGAACGIGAEESGGESEKIGGATDFMRFFSLLFGMIDGFSPSDLLRKRPGSFEAIAVPSSKPTTPSSIAESAITENRTGKEKNTSSKGGIKEPTQRT